MWSGIGTRFVNKRCAICRAAGRSSGSRRPIYGGRAHEGILPYVLNDLRTLRSRHGRRAGASSVGTLLRLGTRTNELRLRQVLVLSTRERLRRWLRQRAETFLRIFIAMLSRLDE